MAAQERNIDKVPDLTAQERETLMSVMQRANDFEKETAKKTIPMMLEGQLYKWTNAFKGWQPRWFSVDHDQGVLHYYTSEDRKKLPPRASLHLWGAVVSPSEEDSQTFNLHGANNEIYRLRAANAKERQHWVAQLRQEVEHANGLAMGTKDFTSTSSVSSPSLLSTNNHSHSGKQSSDTVTTTPKSAGTTPTRKNRLHQLPGHRSSLSIKWRKRGKDGEDHSTAAHVDSLAAPVGNDPVFDSFLHLQELQEKLSVKLQADIVEAGVELHNQNVLLLQATSQAAVRSIRDCMGSLNHRGSLASAGSASPSHLLAPSLPFTQNHHHSVPQAMCDQEDREGGLHRTLSLVESSFRTKSAMPSKRAISTVEVP